MGGRREEAYLYFEALPAAKHSVLGSCMDTSNDLLGSLTLSLHGFRCTPVGDFEHKSFPQAISAGTILNFCLQ